MSVEKRSKYDIGDIVFVSEYTYENNEKGKNHLFVVIQDDDKVLPLEYFGMIVSSQIQKSKENSPFKYNEPLNKSKSNGLTTDSIVKCDNLYEIPKDNIQYKIGTVDVDDFVRFLVAYQDFVDNEKESVTV